MKGLLERLKTSFPGRLAAAYGQSKAGSYAAALAFNGFMTMFPLMLGLLSIVALIVRNEATELRLENVIAGIFPPSAHDELIKAFKGVRSNLGIVGLISIGGLVWGGTSFFAAMEFSLTQIFGTRQRDIFRQRLMGVVMMVVFLAALLVAAGANAAAGSPLPFGQVAGFVVGALVLVGLLTVIYRFVPNRSFRLADIWPGALIAGVLIEVISLVFPVYAQLSHGFNTYGQEFALFFLLATWLYFLSQFLLLGAVLNRMRLGPPREEGMVAQPGDRGETPPPPAEAIDEQREAAGSGAGRGDGRRQPSRAERRDGRRQPSRADRREPSRQDGRGRSADHREGMVKRALFGLLAAGIGLAALSRHPRSDSGDSRPD